jgi:hypothetical protein
LEEEESEPIIDKATRRVRDVGMGQRLRVGGKGRKRTHNIQGHGKMKILVVSKEM